MAGDTITIARPYAEAVFARADATGRLEPWSETLETLTALVENPDLAAVISDPLFSQDKLVELLLDITGESLDDEARNLIRLLVQNHRLMVLPQIAEMYEQLKAESQQILKVHVRSAYELQPAQEGKIAEALKSRLGRNITITNEVDPGLIGGVHIRAGDMVIDGSISGRLQKLSNELGI